MKLSGWILTILILLSTQSFAQLLWQENFNNVTNGSTIDTAPPDTWTTIQPSGPSRKFNKQQPAPGYHLFEVDNTGNEGVWLSQLIDISTAPEAALEVTLYSYFTFSTDYIRCYYKLNGGPEIQFGELLGSNGLNITSAASAIVPGGSAGNTVQIVIRGFDATPGQDNSFGFPIDRALAFDDVTVTKIEVLYSIIPAVGGNWDNGNTWSKTSGGTACGCTPTNNTRVVIQNARPVSFNVDGTSAGVTVNNGGTLTWTANNIALTLARGGTINVANGGTMTKGARNGTSITYGNYIYSIVNNGTLTVGDLNFGAGGSATFSGSGTTTADNINMTMGNGRSITNTMTGGGLNTTRLYYNAANMTVSNSGILTIGNSGLVVVSSAQNGNTLTNTSTGTINMSFFDLNNGDFLVNNSGTLNQSGTFQNIDTGSNGKFDNLGTGIWNWTMNNNTYDNDMLTVFDLTTTGNVFNYAATGNQSIVPVTYYNINLQSGNTKSAVAAFSANGNLTIQNATTLASNFLITISGNTTFQNTSSSSGTGGLTMGGSLTVTDNSTPAGSGTITIGGNATFSSSGNLSGTGALNVGGATAIQTGAQISRTGTLDFSGNLVISGTGALNGTGNVLVGGNWTAVNAASFTEGTRTVTFDGNTTQTISNAAGLETFTNLTINKASGTVTLATTPSTKLTVTTLLTLTQGVLMTTTNELLTINNNGNTNGGTATSYVDGPVRKIGNVPATFIFPTGDNTVWARIAFTYVANASATTEFTARYFDAPYATLANDGSMNNISGREYWTLDRAVTLTTTGRVQLYWQNATRSGINDITSSDLIVGHFTGPKWISAGRSAISPAPIATGSVTSNVITSFSPFTFGSLGHPSNPLPITLTSFSAKLHNDYVSIDWATATELNNESFTVERSSDAETFEAIQTVAGHGTTTDAHTYHTVDNYPIYGRSYYRLRQTDLDGKFTYYKVVTVEYEGAALAALRSYPNPSTGKNITLEIVGLRDQKTISLDLLNAKGELVYHQTLDVKQSGSFKETLSFPDTVQPGLYVLKAGPTVYLTQKIIIQ